MNEFSVFVSTRRRNKTISLIGFFIELILRTVDGLQSDIDLPNQREKERFIVNASRLPSLETSADTYIDFCKANLVKYGMDCFSVPSDFGSLQPTAR